MDKRVFFVIVAVAIVVAGVGLYFTLKNDGRGPPESVETVGGKFNVTISFWEDHAQMEYTDEDGKHSETYFMVEMRDGLDWIKANTPENAMFLCWWDYGHMIKGYAERNVIARNPSEEILESIQCAREDPTCVKEFDPHEKILDVAAALATSNSAETLQIMEKYDATYIVVCVDDLIKASWIYRIAGLEETDYLVFEDSETRFSEAGKQTMIARLLENRDVDFTLIYEDEEIKVYKTD